MEYIEGITMNRLNNDQRSVVEQELNIQCESLHNIRSKAMGGPLGLVSANVPVRLKRSNLKK